MKKFKKVATFVFINRRVIGTVIGGIVALLGYSDEGLFIQRIGEQ